jgi:hypothetical protein
MPALAIGDHNPAIGHRPWFIRSYEQHEDHGGDDRAGLSSVCDPTMLANKTFSHALQKVGPLNRAR